MPTRTRLRYVRNTLSKIVTALATGLEPLQVGLEHQYRALKTLNPDDFPEDLQDDYERLMDALIIQEKKRDAGQLPATFEGMRDHTARFIAEEILVLYQEIDKLYSAE